MYVFFFFFNFWVCVLGSEFVFLLFLFKTYLNLNSYNFFYLVKINKLIFFNLDADVAF